MISKNLRLFLNIDFAKSLNNIILTLRQHKYKFNPKVNWIRINEIVVTRLACRDKFASLDSYPKKMKA
ncbi:hypothetical protein EZJ58_5668 [Sodalis ligni]|uniref:Uncharacterized protein n=1 Tax=Sodalis ligni TaxID=2697027 RepID=A0A4R1NJM5_9GAMM|nr:hypothetical protein EZJ58_5668 [Sodalis ligni]